jgi:thiamine transporter
MEIKEKKKITTVQLVESALMIAIATVCSMVKIDLPFGGGVTILSMLPIILISHRYGWKWGVLVAFVYSVGQMLLGLDNVAYATSFWMGAGIVMLDYVIAYTVIGLSGIFGQKRQSVAIGIAVTFTLRFLCHYMTGVWIWGEWMPEEFMGMKMLSPWIYSALYNGWYMLFELVATEIVAMLIYQPLKPYFQGEQLQKPVKKQA